MTNSECLTETDCGSPQCGCTSAVHATAPQALVSDWIRINGQPIPVGPGEDLDTVRERAWGEVLRQHAVRDPRRLPRRHRKSGGDSGDHDRDRGLVTELYYGVLRRLSELDFLISKLRDGEVDDDNAWALQRALVDTLVRTWQEPDNGLWEIRGRQQHFTHSQAMVWAAFDRAVRGVEDWGLPGPVERWRELRDAGRKRVLRPVPVDDRDRFVGVVCQGASMRHGSQDVPNSRSSASTITASFSFSTPLSSST